jgi:hypothetical protein
LWPKNEMLMLNHSTMASETKYFSQAKCVVPWIKRPIQFLAYGGFWPYWDVTISMSHSQRSNYATVSFNNIHIFSVFTMVRRAKSDTKKA